MIGYINQTSVQIGLSLTSIIFIAFIILDIIAYFKIKNAKKDKEPSPTFWNNIQITSHIIYILIILFIVISDFFILKKFSVFKSLI